MKKLLSMILVACMLMSVLCISASAEETTELTAEQKSELVLRKADADGNGSYSIDDARLLLKAAAGTTADADAYDVNSDGVTTVEDAIAVLKEVMGVEPLLSDDEAVALFNAKLNNVKNSTTGLPGFEKTITATCNSMKITQDVEASGLAAILAGQLECKDLEYDEYVEKMIDVVFGKDDSKLTDSEKQQIAEMRESAEIYRKPQTDTEIAKAGVSVDHFLHFPRDAKNTASEITTADISSITYTMNDGNIVFTLKLPNKTYRSLTAYASNTYAKVMNVVEFDSEDGSTLNQVDLKNGTVVIKFDAKTGAMENANYSYSYYSDVSAPPQSQSHSTAGSITIKLKTKTTATITESIVF